MSEDCCLGQAGRDDGLGKGHCLFLALCTDDLYLKQCGTALTVACHLLCQGLIDVIECLAELLVICVLLGDLCIASHTVCQKQAGIVGGGIAVYGDHVVGVFDISAECFLQQFFGNSKVGGNEGKHGAHIRVDHAGALAHTANGNGLSADPNLNSDFLFLRISCHDGLGCLSTALDGAGKLRSHGGDSCF